MMKYDLVIFDMDGTILNTLEDLTDSLNATLSHFDYPSHSMEDVRHFVGNGIGLLISRAVPAGTSKEQEERVYAYFMEYYPRHCAQKTRPYEGIEELITCLRKEGCKVAVVSNKADVAVKELAEQYFPGAFDIAVGERTGIARKPAPDSVNEVLRMLQIPREKAVYIGDSEVDIATARNAGLESIIVEWGFREKKYLLEKGGKVFADRPESILKLLEGMR